MRTTHRICLLLATVAACVSAPRAFAVPTILISVPDQKLVLVEDGQRIAQYAISTSRYGLGDRPRSYSTPLGNLEVASKIGADAPTGAVFKGRVPTGEVLPANAAGRDPIVTRILWLRGLEARNSNAFERAIYIHGTPVERQIGRPASYGCIRMRSRDVIALFDAVPVGTKIEIVNKPIKRAIAEHAFNSRETHRAQLAAN